MEQRTRRLTRGERAVRAGEVAARHGGVAHRADLRAVGVSRADVRSELAAGRWSRLGRHTVLLGTGAPGQEARWWQAVWETGAGAVLDGVSALQAAGLTGFAAGRIDVAIRTNNRVHRPPGVRVRQRRDLGPVMGAGIPRTRPEQATVRGALWAASDRQAALVVCLAVQQRLVPPGRLLAAAGAHGPHRRRRLVQQVVADVCDGAHSLGELDLGRWCHRYGIPPPTRQRVRIVAGGRVYLDAAWEDAGLVVEVDGGHHALALGPVDDALRQNELALGSDLVLRLPVLGLRLEPERFMDQVRRGHERRTRAA
ncbi:hypothetical protein H9L10_08790 [Phycicoccus endophyticus]|uniref:DUF559 domain-containing protein n=1 Tax=Phycicoccus endophyticus TaxID=1690220 RepID=A0A7G9QYL5_9MICO|nr:hypothetical protein [Phycicoccus endophyticus]NHI19344.1 hypothetical protein [Phycicoccus endophyticus]QNN48440.1 hypothetical protein H9L10_08790 [Phycicoccus endophyticus]